MAFPQKIPLNQWYTREDGLRAAGESFAGKSLVNGGLCQTVRRRSKGQLLVPHHKLASPAPGPVQRLTSVTGPYQA